MQQLATQYGINKIDLLGYDCCLMGMAEVGYETSSLTDVFVGSEETEPGDGWEYQRWLASLKANPTADAKTLGGYIVSAYYGTGYSTLSAADMTQTTTFVNAVNALADALIAAVPSYKTKIKNARTATKKYTDTTYLDLYDFCAKLKLQSLPSAVTTAATNLQTVITSNYILAKGGTAANSYGVSIWFPAKLTTATYNTYHNTIKWGAASHWDEFLDTYY
jgi:hypothetical protein